MLPHFHVPMAAGMIQRAADLELKEGATAAMCETDMTKGASSRLSLVAARSTRECSSHSKFIASRAEHDIVALARVNNVPALQADGHQPLADP